MVYCLLLFLWTKFFTKIIASNANIQQAKYLWFYDHQLKQCEEIVKQIEKELQYPCFIKPANTGSSIGISKAHNREELEKHFTMLHNLTKK